MRYSVLIFICTILLFSCSTEQEKKLKDYNLNGEVEIVINRTYKCKYENGKIIKGDKNNPHTDDYKLSFNDKGLLTERVSLSMYGNPRRKTTYWYRNNKISEVKNHSLDENSQTNSIYSYYNNKIVIAKTDEKGNPDGVMEIKTNNEGQDTEGFYINERGIKNNSWKNEYQNGRIHKMTEYDSLGKLTSTTTYKWNSNNDLEEEHHNDNDWSYTDRYKYKYDNKNNWVWAEQYHEWKSYKSYGCLFDPSLQKDTIIHVRTIKYYGDPPIEINKLNDSILIGKWIGEYGGIWIEFRKERKYDRGKNESADDTGTYEYDKDERTISFISKKSQSEKYYIAIEGNKIALKSIGRRGERVFQKK